MAAKTVDVCFTSRANSRRLVTSRANSSCACALDKRSIIAIECRRFAL